jgi:hypothetical protein
MNDNLFVVLFIVLPAIAIATATSFAPYTFFG